MVLCGADDFVAVETFAVGRREWLQQFFGVAQWRSVTVKQTEDAA